MSKAFFDFSKESKKFKINISRGGDSPKGCYACMTIENITDTVFLFLNKEQLLELKNIFVKKDCTAREKI